MEQGKNTLTLREREIWNEAVRDTLKEVWLYNGIIPDDFARETLCRNVQEKISYKKPEPTPLVLIPYND